MKVICFDLDDTLYKEIDYLKSAYREIASFAAEQCHGCSDSPMILAAKAYDAMLVAYYDGENVFERLNDFLGIDVSVAQYLRIYRNHKPQISLSKRVVQTLDTLKANECIIGIITDGRSVQQRSKIKALGLNYWVENENIVISEEFGSKKPTSANYEYFMERYHVCNDFIYVGDNPQKDFVAPNTLGWITICLLDNGQNVHKQEFLQRTENYLPQKRIKSITELLSPYSL